MDKHGILRQGDNLLGFGDIQDEADVIRAMTELSVVKEALKAADRFREESVKYAKYEAYALVRAVEISGDSHLIKGKWRKLAAEWLSSISKEERDAAIEMCSDGKTIDNVYKEVVAEPERQAALSEAAHEAKADARRALRASGVVSVSTIMSKYQSRFPRSMRDEISNGVRKAIRDEGGVGIGDGATTYIDPNSRSDYVGEAIRVRIESVTKDIESIADLAGRSKSLPVFRVNGDGRSLGFCDVTYLILAGVGCAKIEFDNVASRKNAVSLIKQIAGDVR